MSPVPTLETLQFYCDTHDDKFGIVKLPKRVAEDACGTIELLIAENKRYRLAIEWCLDRDNRNGSLPEAYAEKLRPTLSQEEATNEQN